MHAPISMLVGAGNSKAIAVIVVLVGLSVVVSIQRKQAALAASAAPGAR